MRFNAKKNQDLSDNPSSSPPYSMHSDSSPADTISFSQSPIHRSNRLVPIDILGVDKHSRITLTRNVRNAISLHPFDTIIVYRDILSNNLVLEFRKERDNENDKEEPKSESISTSSSIWTLTKVKGNSASTEKANTKGQYQEKNSDNKRNGINYNGGDPDNGNPSIFQRTNNTLYSIPILLVDDEQDLSSSFALILKMEGYRNVTAFSDPRRVLSHVCNPKYYTYYRMAIIDIRMPDINGIKLYQILKILNPRIRVLFVTALDAIDEITSVYPDVQPMDIVRKPVSKEQFVSAVNDKVSGIVLDW